jgi:hypothetical protein
MTISEVLVLTRCSSVSPYPNPKKPPNGPSRRDHVQSLLNHNPTRVSTGNSLPNVVSVGGAHLRSFVLMLWHSVSEIHFCPGQQVSRLLGTWSCWSRITSFANCSMFEEQLWISMSLCEPVLCRPRVGLADPRIYVPAGTRHPYIQHP